MKDNIKDNIVDSIRSSMKDNTDYSIDESGRIFYIHSDTVLIDTGKNVKDLTSQIKLTNILLWSSRVHLALVKLRENEEL